MRSLEKVGTGGPPVRDWKISGERRTRGPRVPTLVAALTLITSLALNAGEPPRKVTYEDDVLPIFRDNCLKCHNPDKLKGDLDLTSFGNAIKGGGSGATLNAGDPEGSQLYKSITHSDEPTMPPNGKLNDKDIATIRAWIEGGLLRGVNSKALTANKPAVDLALKSGAVGKPEGPPPMPGPLALEPFVPSLRGTALGALAASPWAPVVALAGTKQVVLYRTDDREYLGVLPFPEGLPCDVKFSRNGKLLLAGGGRGGHSGLVTVWDIATAQRVITIGDQFDSVLAADITADQRWIALGGPDRVLKIYQTKDGTLEHRIKKHTEWVTAVEFSPDGKYLASGDRNGGLVLWETETGQELFTLNGHKAAITAVTWRSDSELFASASEDGTLKLWKASDGSSLRSINVHAGGALAARFSSDGRLVTTGRDNKIILWDITGKNLRALPFSGELPTRVTFSGDATKVFASDWNGRVFTWETATGKALGELDAFPPSLADRVLRLGAQLKDLAAQVAKAHEARATAQREMAAAELEANESKALLARGASSEEINALRQRAESANKRVAAAKKSLTATNGRATEAEAAFAAAKTSLAKWQAALDRERSARPAEKVSLR